MSAVPEPSLGAAANDADAQETREWLDALSPWWPLKAVSVATS